MIDILSFGCFSLDFLSPQICLQVVSMGFILNNLKSVIYQIERQINKPYEPQVQLVSNTLVLNNLRNSPLTSEDNISHPVFLQQTERQCFEKLSVL